jgi:hypothetical protein
MHYITFLYLLISAVAAGATRSFRHLAMSNPFPSLPAAVHRIDSADAFAWKKSLGAALTGHPVNNSSKKHLRGAYYRGSYHDLIMAAPPQHINDPKAMGINRAIRRGLY